MDPSITHTSFHNIYNVALSSPHSSQNKVQNPLDITQGHTHLDLCLSAPVLSVVSILPPAELLEILGDL